MKFKGAIFDLDGTIAYTLPDLHVCLNRMLEVLGYPLKTIDDVLYNVNYCEREYIRHSIPESEMDNEDTVDRCVSVYSEIYEKHFCDNTTVYDGLGEVISRLKESGIRLAVNTNKNHSHACEMLKKLLPDETFEIIVGDGIYKHKPSPEGALSIADYFGLKPEEICFIGDSNVDMETANNAGMFALGVTWGYRSREVLLEYGADAIAEKVGDILEIIGI